MHNLEELNRVGSLQIPVGKSLLNAVIHVADNLLWPED